MNWSWILPENYSTFGADADALYYLILWITGFVFVLTEGLLLYFVLRYRHKEGRKASFHHGSTKAEVTWTLIPLVILIWIGVESTGVWELMKRDVPPDAMEVIVTAQQFEWNVTYPGLDGILGTEDDFTLLNQLHAPQDRPILVYLRATDVIHSFFLPEMRVKQDAVPGQEMRVWFEATAPGQYTLGCAELCGTGHTTMNGILMVHTQQDYDNWVASQVGQQQ